MWAAIAEFWWIGPTMIGAGTLGWIGLRGQRSAKARRLAYDASRDALRTARQDAAASRIAVRVARAELAQAQAEAAAGRTTHAEVAAALEVSLGTPVVRVRRLRRAEGEPLALLTNFLPLALAPDEDELKTVGLYEALRSRGVQPKIARQRIGARAATASEARELDEPARAALLTMERTAYDDAGQVIEFGRHIYRASRYMFDTTVFAH